MTYEHPPEQIARELEAKLAGSQKYSALAEQTGWYRAISYSKSNGLWQASITFSNETSALLALFEYRTEPKPSIKSYWYLVRDWND